MSVGPLCLVIPYIFHQALHAAKPYRCVNFSNQHFPQAVLLYATTLVLKCLRYSRGIGQVQIRYLECKIQAKSALKWAWQDRYILRLVDCSHFVLQLRFYGQNKMSATPLLARFQIQDSRIYILAVQADSSLIQQSP